MTIVAGRGQAGLGTAGHGKDFKEHKARRGWARRAVARLGTAGILRQHKAGRGKARCGMAWRGKAGRGKDFFYTGGYDGFERTGTDTWNAD